MNHVPDDALEAIDAFGEGLLRGSPRPVRERLRSDLRLRIDPIERDDGGGDGDGPRGVARCRFETEHTRAPPRLRDRGSFVCTVVDNVESRLEPWGLDPPPAYEYAGTVEGWHRYEGRLERP
ncbi:hypothetical protein [Natronomonas sp.]|uniref:hypothetical protein n=1 Tax=Natronomonas sp. TaxID=2184060 RepID=UPI002634773F|nr:hypothetical protein [Natronomonas sp.]